MKSAHSFASKADSGSNPVPFSFEKLGFSPQLTLLILLLILFGSLINIPLTRKRLVRVEEPQFFGLFKIPKIKAQGIAINLGGAIIPVLLSFYFLYHSWEAGFNLAPVLIATILMIIVSKSLAKPIPGRGIILPFFIPPLFSALFAVLLGWWTGQNLGFLAPCAFVSGVLGTLIGADLLNLRRAQKLSPEFLSIGGAGVFDGIFLVGIISALLTGL